MKTQNRTWRVLLFGTIALLASLGSAAAQDSVLYELTERMVFGPGTGLVSRIATSALQGTAELGTPWCPLQLKYVFNVTSCTITAIGTDDVDVVPFFDPPANTMPNPHFGQGTVSAEWATVLNFDNAVDGPEYVVLTGRLKQGSTINLVAAASGAAPLGSLHGTFEVDGNADFGIPPSTTIADGTFRLPFAKDLRGKMDRPRRGKDAFYMRDDGKSFPLRKSEYALGWPTVRLELTFQP